MVYTTMVLAPRLPSITHAQFKTRYEQHMHLVADLVGPANMPLSHTRWYPQHSGPDDAPQLLAGSADDFFYDCIVTMVFEDESHFARFTGALMTEEANKKIEADEAGFWDRTRMKVIAGGEMLETKRQA